MPFMILDSSGGGSGSGRNCKRYSKFIFLSPSHNKVTF